MYAFSSQLKLPTIQALNGLLMPKTLRYLFDPLCGWCYGASPLISGLVNVAGLKVALHPTGRFSGKGARPMDADFAAYAWSNDQRIERLTGQRFSDEYQSRILGESRQRFDSGPATLALTAVSLTAPERETDALKAIQNARYVNGNDVVSLANLASLLQAIDLEAAAAKLAHLDVDLLNANQARVSQSQALMRQFNARGVPTLILESVEISQVLDHTAAYSNPGAWISQLDAV
jgi:putative protein-disulfide isomerase